MYNLYAVWALPNGTFYVVKQLATSGSNQYQNLSWPLSSYLGGMSGSESTNVGKILTESEDWTAYPNGSALYMGYGITVEEMVQAKRYSLKYVKNF